MCGYRQVRHAPLLGRRLPSALMNAYVRRQERTAVRDIGCGMRGFQSSVIRDLHAEGERRRFLTPVFLRRARRVIEVPLSPGRPRTSAGHSFLTLLTIAADYFLLTAHRPFLMTGLVAAAAIVAGIAVLVAGATLPGLVIVATGGLAGLLSLIGEYCQRLYQLAQDVPFYQLRDLDDEAPITDVEAAPAASDVPPSRATSGRGA